MVRKLLTESNGGVVNDTPLLSAKEIAVWLSLHPQTVYLLVKKGTIPAIRIGRILRFDPTLVATALNITLDKTVKSTKKKTNQ